ncbi:alcohol dehydrogenase catalytic domain-containing protein [Acuticoccus mangrovi]|uniref:Alcohol dehydrogenase catalytic domain-containing protein n=1 Tax=Acuticoccus mangrovi TaxID=2796142 RepID=A0A934MJ89_9HYPH|nr:alcohol dehydrogenase catalytic domain-containing protein [Acuticoccus mangrovi]MBJ3778031.1 alcohol dehydrogenase catalytic domain-containing protein [Acuticoccus mangrovi]
METRSLVLARPERDAVELMVRELPAVGPGEALVRIRKAGICGTDLHIIGWNAWAQRAYRPPLALGHELCGDIVEIGAGGEFAVGDRVTAETHLACGTCDQCRRDRGHTCDNLKTFTRLGLGAFADLAVIPVPLLRRVPAGVSDRVGAAMEPLGIAIRAVEAAAAEADRLMVSGCGPIGLFAVAAARAMTGATIQAVDPSDARLDLARMAGADIACRPEALGELAACDAVIETSGVQGALDAAFRQTRKGGRIVYCGLPSEPLSVDVTGQIVLREVALEGVYGRHLTRTWRTMSDLLEQGLDIEPLLTAELPIERFGEALRLARAGTHGKIVFDLSTSH